MSNLNFGSLVISLDFEMMWGCHDWTTPEEYGESNVSNVREVIAKLLQIFEKYGIHATFATVGRIFHKDLQDAIKHNPKLLPSYNDGVHSPYRITTIAQPHEELFFAPDIIQQLKVQPNIEIGTHTYGHYFCWEPGQTIEQFEADLETARSVANQDRIAVESIVFPRNQVSKEYLDVCSKQGILTYRGNARKYFDFTTNRWKNLYNKVSRLIDAYVNWGGNTTIPYVSIDGNERPVNIPASRMLRPYMRKLRLLEPLRLRRIKREMLHAAKYHELYHLWWHPHNFGADMEQNLAFLEEVLKCYQTCHQQYGMQSLTMKELYYKLLNNN